MAIQVFDEGPTLGGLVGGGVSRGISSGMEQLTKTRQRKQEQRNLYKLLQGAGVPENISAAVSAAPQGLQRSLLWNLGQQQQQQPPLQQEPVQPIQQQQAQVPGAKDLNSLKRIRMQLLKQSAKPAIKKKLFGQLTKMGLGKAEISVLMGTELTEDVAKFFLNNAGGDKKAARKLAKAFGYEV